MRRLAVLTALATVAASPLAAAPATAAFAPAGGVAEIMRAAQLVCHTDLRGSACAARQQRLLSTAVADACDGNKTAAAQRVASRQLDALIASIR